MPLFHASPPAGRRHRTTATEPSEIASGWALEILPPRSSRFPQPLAPTFQAEANRPSNVVMRQPQAHPRANAHDPATRPSGFPAASSRLVPSRFHRPSSPIPARTRTCDRNAARSRRASGRLKCRRLWPDNAQSRSSSTIIRSMFVSFLAILTNERASATEWQGREIRNAMTAAAARDRVLTDSPGRAGTAGRGHEASLPIIDR